MRRIALTTAAALAAAALSVLPGGPPASAQPATGGPAEPGRRAAGRPRHLHPHHRHRLPGRPRADALDRLDLVYQYTCGPAPTGPGEVIRMATSCNGGSTWSSETVVLQPSTERPRQTSRASATPPSSRSPDYFYLAYTGISSDGTRRLFVARAINPGGPFTKWNGTDWTGGIPAPLIDRDALAAGPSLVNRAGTIHLFYNTRITTGPAAGTYQTRHATATLGTNPSTWPTRLTADPGVAIDHPGKYTGTDCVGSHWWADTDVKYDETTGKYLAITSDQSSYPWSALQAYESTDGTTFTRAIITRGDYQPGARNPGQLADPYGHLTPNATKAIGYAHSTTCGQADLRYTTTTQTQPHHRRHHPTPAHQRRRLAPRLRHLEHRLRWVLHPDPDHHRPGPRDHPGHRDSGRLHHHLRQRPRQHHPVQTSRAALRQGPPSRHHRPVRLHRLPRNHRRQPGPPVPVQGRLRQPGLHERSTVSPGPAGTS